MKKVQVLACGVFAGLIWGCPGETTPPPENPAAVLEGTWSLSPEGAPEGFTYEATFNSDGEIVQIFTEGPGGATSTRDIDGATTEVNGAAVTITVPLGDNTTTVFQGTLSDDQNTMTGSLTQEIDFENVDVTVPAGDLTLTRIE